MLLSYSSFTYIVDINEYISVHSANLTEHCFAYLLLSLIVKERESRKTAAVTSTEGKGEEQLQSTNHMSGPFTC